MDKVDYKIMLVKKIRNILAQITRHSILLIASFILLAGSYSHSVELSVETKTYQSLMRLSGLATHTFIDSLLFVDGDQRAQESMQQSIVNVDGLLFDLNSGSDINQETAANLNIKWQAVKKEISGMPDKPGYSYFYLERLSKVVSEFTLAVNEQLDAFESHVSVGDKDIYQANSEVLAVVSMHLSSAVMDIGNDEKSKSILAKQCRLADSEIHKVTSTHASVKSYVLRSWKYIQGPICKTGKKGGNYTIAHFSKQISLKLQKLYGTTISNTQVVKGGL